MPVFLLAMTLLTTGWALWVRRSSLTCKWEGAPTLAIVCVAPATYLHSQHAAPLGRALHAVTGVWNLEELIGHLLVIAWACAAVYMGLVRFADESAIHEYYTQWVTRPVIIALALLQATWVASPAGETPVARFVDLGPSPWLLAYWTIRCVLMVYLVVFAIRIVWRLRAIRSTLVLNMYLAALCTMILCLIILSFDVATPLPLRDAGARVGSLGVIMWTVAAGLSWRFKSRADYAPDVPAPVDSDADRVRGRFPIALGDSDD